MEADSANFLVRGAAWVLDLRPVHAVLDVLFGDYGTIHYTIATAILKTLIMYFVFLMPVASILTWMERRESAMMQDRLGPNRANLPFLFNTKLWGITHFMADAVKFMFKEDFIPPKAHKFLFALAPILAMAPALMVSAIIPFGAPLCSGAVKDVGAGIACQQPVILQVAQLDAGVLFYFALSSISVYGATLAGWASHNKWSMMGGLRASSQMMSYEVTMGMSVLGMFLIYGTLEPGAMVARQGGYPWEWGIWGLPQLICFLLFLTAAIAETKRTPFDIPEGEPEIIGYFVEYSGLRFGLFFLGEFIEIVCSSALIVTIFLGGWKFPGWEWCAAHWSSLGYSLFSVGVWFGKVFLFCGFQLLLRWSLPRFRSDQLMQLGWQRLLPVSIANVVLTAAWVLYKQVK